MAFMADVRRKRTRIYMIFLVAMIFFILSMGGCEKEGNSQNLPGKDKPSSAGAKENIVLPLKVAEGRFFSAFDWINNNVFVYVTESGEGASVFAYDLKKEKAGCCIKAKRRLFP